MKFLENLLINILANAIFWFVLGFLIWLFIKSTQSRFLRFFGLDKTRKLVVYLSNLWVPTTEKPKGYILSGHEFCVAELINSLFGSTPFRFPDIVRGLVDSFWIGKKIDKKITVSPLNIEELVFTNMILVGAAVRNNARRYYVDTKGPYLLTADDNSETQGNAFNAGIKINKGHRKNEVITGNYNFAIVEKIFDDEHKTIVFMCVGTRGDSSWAATEYLVRHWRELRKKYKDKEFALCLGFPKSENYMNVYEEPIILNSFPF